MEQVGKVMVKSTVSAVLTKADGTVIDLGVICGSEHEQTPKEVTLWNKIRRILKNG